jgi:hypothetical protein
MKNYIHYFVLLLGIVSCFWSCEIAPDPGFDAALQGKVIDDTKAPVFSDILSNNVIINALGERDATPIVIRVKGDGTYTNTRMFPKKYKCWVQGPVFRNAPDTTLIDLSDGQSIAQDFSVVPFLNIKLALKGTPAENSVTLTYTITGNRTKRAATREIYVSTVPFPTRSVGSGPTYTTFTAALTTDSGERVITGLAKKTKYFIRMGANGTGDLMNYSEQIVITTP